MTRGGMLGLITPASKLINAQSRSVCAPAPISGSCWCRWRWCSVF